MISSSQIRQKARESLKRNFVPIVLTLFLIGLVPLLISFIEEIVLEKMQFSVRIQEIANELSKIGISSAYGKELFLHFISINIAYYLWQAIFYLAHLFTFCFELSICAVFLITATGEDYYLKDFKDAFKKIKASFCLNLLISIKIFLWSLLFIIPGIIKFFSYLMANHIRLENPELSASECIKKSEEMMKNRKGDLFGLFISFIGWIIILSLISVFFEEGLLYIQKSGVSPLVFSILLFLYLLVTFVLSLPLEAYIGVAEAHFYLELEKEIDERNRVKYEFDNSAYQEYLRKRDEESGRDMFDTLDHHDDFYTDKLREEQDE